MRRRAFFRRGRALDGQAAGSPEAFLRWARSQGVSMWHNPATGAIQVDADPAGIMKSDRARSAMVRHGKAVSSLLRSDRVTSPKAGVGAVRTSGGPLPSWMREGTRASAPRRRRRIRRSVSASSWPEDDAEWPEDEPVYRRSGHTRRSRTPAPSAASLRREIAAAHLENERSRRAHEDRIRRQSTRATRRQVRQQTRDRTSATELFSRARSVMRDATRSAVRGVTADPEFVRAALERLAGREGHPGRYLRGHVPLEVESLIESTKEYLDEHLDTEAPAATAAPGNYLPHGAPHHA